MDHPPDNPGRNHHRPQIYVSLEFGVSWSPSHAPRPHAVHYRSRGLRERSPNFPRQVAPRSTNYLASSASQPQTNIAHYPQHQYQLHHEHPHQLHHQHQHQHYHPNPRQLQSVRFHEPSNQQEGQPSRRSSRSSRSSHERGRSAPPPISDNSWDVVRPRSADQRMTGTSTAEASSSRPPPSLWKELPEVPSRYRLGEDGMPWSSWSWPMGYNPDAVDEASASDPFSSPNVRHTFPERQQEDGDTFANSPTVVSIQSPIHEPRYRREDPERVRDLEALGQAMMTIDNGFEDQWWNQGERQPMATLAGDLITSPPVAPPQHGQPHLSSSLSMHDFASATLGWTSALPQGAADERLAFATANNIVSPMTEYGSPAPAYTGLNRTMSTRSEELWFSGDRYA